MSVYTKFDSSSCHKSQDLAGHSEKKRTNRPRNIRRVCKFPSFLCNTKLLNILVSLCVTGYYAKLVLLVA